MSSRSPSPRKVDDLLLKVDSTEGKAMTVEEFVKMETPMSTDEDTREAEIEKIDPWAVDRTYQEPMQINEADDDSVDRCENKKDEEENGMGAIGEY